MEFSKETQLRGKKPKVLGKIKQVSNDAAVRNAEYHKVLEEIDQERLPICQGCGKPEFEHSHSLPRNYRNYAFMSNKMNIWRLCRGCHVNYENGRVWGLKCGKELMLNILVLDAAYYNQKSEQIRKRLEEYKSKNWLAISNKSITLPDWIKDYENG